MLSDAPLAEISRMIASWFSPCLARARAAFDKATRGYLRLSLPEACGVVSPVMIVSPNYHLVVS
jgi:hypothetical protein